MPTLPLMLHLFIISIILPNYSFSSEPSVKLGTCDGCKSLIRENFLQHLKSSATENYGGGNTHWEEQKLGSFLSSEVRLFNIFEKMCKKSNVDDVSSQAFTLTIDRCYQELDNFEESIERWWKSEIKNLIKLGKGIDTQIEKMFHDICISEQRLCCPINTFGASCEPCGELSSPRNHLPCSNKGECDGNGTRQGSGQCKCVDGYIGSFCETCKTGFFDDSESASEFLCKQCFQGCSEDVGCKGPSSTECNGICKTGWMLNENDSSCDDIDECSDPQSCPENKYCINLPGSFQCKPCDVSCDSCKDRGDNCSKCKTGYKFSETSKTDCIDIDECQQSPGICKALKNTICVNTQGSYTCVCDTGFVYDSSGKGCIQQIRNNQYFPKKGSKSLRRKKIKIIWTVNFFWAFMPLLGALVAFAFVVYITKGHTWINLSLAIPLGLFIYTKSVELDGVFANA